MIEKAKEKITKEMESNKAMYVQVVGKYLLEQIEINKKATEAIVAEGKTIQGAVLEMAKEAKKRVIDEGPLGMAKIACITDSEGFEIVRKYFGFEAVQDRMLDVDVHDIKEETKIETPVKKEVDFNVSLKDLL